VLAAQAQLALLNTNTRYLHDNLTRYAERLTAAIALLFLRQRDAVGQRRQHAGQPQPLQHLLEVWGNRRGGARRDGRGSRDG